MNNGRIIQQLNAQQQAESMLQAEIRATTRELYVRLAGPYIEQGLCGLCNGDKQAITAEVLRAMSLVAWKAAQYTYTGAGIVNVDDVKLWGGETPS